MPVPIRVVDAFTEQVFRGNPAGVCLLDGWPDDDWLAAVAAEINLSETAFVVPRPDGNHDLRWFTPSTEVDLCGHATLASAHVLGGPRRFHTRSGVLTCTPSPDGTWWMDFPADPPSEVSVAAGLAAELAGALGAAPAWVGAGRFDWLVEVADASIVRALTPDLAGIAAAGRRAVIVTAVGDEPGIDLVSRCFGPNVGVPEDPVTGSAHCTLAGYWSPKLGRDELVARQVSARGGVVRMRLAGDRVALGGRAVSVWEGLLLAEPPR